MISPAPYHTGHAGIPQTTNAVSHTPLPFIQYDGQLGQVTRIWLVNLALFFVTLSFYRFWGRTRIRQYVWSHFSLFGDRLEYLGTGKELCIGFLITLPIYGLLILLSELSDSGIGFIAILVVGYFAVYSGLRYRITRTSWRAIRGVMPLEGSKTYSVLCLKRAFFNVTTLGILIPESDMLKWECLVHHMKIGNVALRFRFDMKGLMLPHMLTSILSVGLIAIFFRVTLGMIPEIEGDKQERIEIMAGFFTLALVLALPLLMMIRQWYAAILVRKRLSGISIGNITISTHFSVWRFIGFKCMNMLILLLTLGLGGAFILHRKAVFFSRYITMHGTLDEAMLLQEALQANKFSEGFIDTFGVDLSIFS